MTEGKEETIPEEVAQTEGVVVEAVETQKEPEMPEGLENGERLISEGNEPLGVLPEGENGGFEEAVDVAGAAPALSDAGQAEAPPLVMEEVVEPPAPAAASPEPPVSAPAPNTPPAPTAAPSIPPAPTPPPSILNTSREYMRTLTQKAREKISFRTTARLEKIMRHFETHQHITNDDVEKLLRVSDATATRYLQELERQKKIIQEGITGASVRYRKA